MENASKALLIAAGVLIVILIVTLGIKILSPIEGTKQSAAEVGQSLSDKTASAISSILGLEEKIPETPAIYFSVIQSSGALTLSEDGKEAMEAGKLTEINIPSQVGDIKVNQVYGFNGYNQIKTVYISEGITEIGADTFRGCINLTEITLPSTLNTIGYRAFKSVGSATTEGIKELKIPNGVEKIENETFDYANIKKVIIPSTVTTIEVGAFKYSEIEEVEIKGNNLTIIGWNAFFNCEKLKKIKLPEGLKTIGENAFHFCSSLNATFDSNGNFVTQRNINIPATVTTIEQNAFAAFGNTNSSKNKDKGDIYMSITEEEASQRNFGSNWHGGGRIHWKE